jgi:hypothetical protein
MYKFSARIILFRCLLISSLGIVNIIQIFAQNYTFRHSSIDCSMNHQAIRESLNSGLLFSGVGFGIHYRHEALSSEEYSVWNAELSGSILRGRGIIGFAGNIMPLSYGHSWRITQLPHHSDDSALLYVGLQTDYSTFLQVYPDLQMGQLFWTTSLLLSPEIHLFYPIGIGMLQCSANISAIGFASRTPQYREGYFFSLNPGTIASEIHRHVSLVSLPHFTRFNMNLSYFFPFYSLQGSGVRLEYNLQSLSISKLPEFVALRHKVGIAYVF